MVINKLMFLRVCLVLCGIAVLSLNLLGCQQDKSPQDVLTVSLAAGEGETPFAHSMSLIRPLDPDREGFWGTVIEPVTGIPDTLLDPLLYAQHIQIRQLVHQSFVTGKMDTAFYEGWTSNADFDPSNYTDEFVDQQVQFILAHDADSNRVLIYDADNDEDFSDETAHILPDVDPDEGWVKMMRQLPNIPVQVDMYDGERVVSRTVNLHVNPFIKTAMGKTAILFGGLEFQTGELVHEGQKYAWWVANPMSPGVYTPLATRFWYEPLPDESAPFPVRPAEQEAIRAKVLAAMESDSTSNGEEMPDGNYPHITEPYEVGDFIQLGDDTFTIAGIDMVGETLTLERSETSGIGLRTNMLAPEFEGPGLDSTTVRLSDFRGKYVLIDFWGTWCGPCLGEIPYLKEVYESYTRDEFDILAVANDEIEALRSFVEEEDLPWTQVVQYEGDETLVEVLKLYRITGYPTTFLIDPEGVIVARENELRGERLATTLAKHL